jgi:hypothetical protein
VQHDNLPVQSISADMCAEMKYIVATLYSNYSTSIVDDTDIKQIDSYTAPPKSDRFIIRLEKVHG